MSSITRQFYPVLAHQFATPGKTGILVSGGMDSEILMRAAADVLGNTATVAFIAVTPFLAEYYLSVTEKFTKETDVELIRVPVDTLCVTEVRLNTSQRCYHCKKAIFGRVKQLAEEMRITTLADGTTLSDISEYRPGLKAAEELGIQHPFLLAEMTGTDVLALGKHLGMNSTGRPSDSCLATRIPENTVITPELLALAAEIEQPLRPHAKYRLRAQVSHEGITLEYQTKDKKLVDAHRQELNSIAESHGLGIAFHENT